MGRWRGSRDPRKYSLHEVDPSFWVCPKWGPSAVIEEERWRASSDLVWVRFDDSPQCIVYSPASADVHLLTDAAHRLWSLISDTPGISTAQLLSSAVTPPGTTEREVAAAILDLLASMDQAGLVQPETE